MEMGSYREDHNALVLLTREFLENALVRRDKLLESDDEFLVGYKLPTDGFYLSNPGNTKPFRKSKQGFLLPTPISPGLVARLLEKIPNGNIVYETDEESCLMTKTGLSWQGLLLYDAFYRTAELTFKSILRQMKITHSSQ